MPRDIRSYFQGAKANTSVASARSTKRRIISSDEDDEVLQSPLKRSKKANVPRKGVIQSDSEEDVKQKKMISPADMFGKSQIDRHEASKIYKRLRKKEAKGHDDDEFEATLSQLDTSNIEEKYLAETKVNKDSDVFESNFDTGKNKKSGKKERVSKSSGGKSSVKTKTRNRMSSNTSSNEDTGHEISKHIKSKNIKKSPKASFASSKIQVESNKKQEASPEKLEALDIYEERIEKKKQHAVMYQQYLQRGGAKNPGSKEIPTGAEYCLAGLSFVLTGVLDSLEREEAEEIIKKYGGRILHQVSRKTSYVIIGDQPGPAKLAKAKSLNIKQISEDDLLEMIRTMPTGQANSVQQSQSKSKNILKQKSRESEDSSPCSPKKTKVAATEEIGKAVRIDSPNKKKHSNQKTEKLLTRSLDEGKYDNKNVERSPVRSPVKKELSDYKESFIQNEEYMNEIKMKADTSKNINSYAPVQALVEKYRPTTMKQILGQQGEKSNAKKLYTWLMNWHKNQSGLFKHNKPSPWAKDDNGAFFKAALLSGPPGIGKTTTVQVVCNELGFDLVEFNASDTRSKKLLKEEVSELLSNTSLKNYFTETKSKPTSKHVLLMDEVDGMAGNEDRGGLQELISLIKSSDIPIICICNDRNNPKMRTLSNYTYDLRFSKPRLEQIRGAMKSICFKENITIPTEDLDRLIESTNHDIRQVINHLALFVGQSGSQEKSERKNINKDLKLGPWEVIKKVFSTEEHKHMSISDKSNLFFHDYNIAPLFVQENYLLVIPQGPKNKLLNKIADCAQSLAMGDIAEKAIRNSNAWSLLPVQACYSTVIPGTIMSGHIGGQINFPAWLGRNSKTGKFDRLLQEITAHTRLTTGASKEAISLDYIKHLRNIIVRPLTVNGSEGIDAAVNVMNHYHLLREDLDSLIELTLWPGDRDPMQGIDSKVKAAFTRTYNKHSANVPYAVSGTSKKKAVPSMQEEALLEEEEEINSDENDNDVETDKMIKAKKTSTSKNAEPKAKSVDKSRMKDKGSSDKPNKRGRGRGRGK